MLRVYVAADCPASLMSLELVTFVQTHYPDLPLEVVDIGEPGAMVPEYVFGTPIYAWDDHVVFLGNPSEEELAALCEEMQWV
jgi:hypothetical protein